MRIASNKNRMTSAIAAAGAATQLSGVSRLGRVMQWIVPCSTMRRIAVAAVDITEVNAAA